ncbi:MAG: thioredoxin family protein [Coriobacteriia bacterium]|nr:thioredoxin family protein [Coriobacteriia bacterium]
MRDDPVAVYDTALKTGKPIYVLFHSLTCDPCIQISAVADQVVMEYEGKVTFVNAITDDADGGAL